MEEKQSIEVIEKKLRAKDWSKIDASKLNKLATLKNKISDSTMKEIVEAIPEFADVAKESLTSINTSYETILQSNKELPTSIQKACKIKMKALKKVLDEEELTFEQKKYVLDEMSSIINELSRVDKENKKFMMETFISASTALVGVVALLVSVVNNRD